MFSLILWLPWLQYETGILFAFYLYPVPTLSCLNITIYILPGWTLNNLLSIVFLRNWGLLLTIPCGLDNLTKLSSCLLCDLFTACVTYVIRLCCSDATKFPDFSYYFSEYSEIIPERNNGPSNTKKTQVVINWSYPLNLPLLQSDTA